MNLDRKIVTGVSSVLVLCTLLTSAAMDFDNNRKIECDSFGLLTSAGAIAQIQQNSEAISAGVSNSVDGTVAIIDMDSSTVGQGQEDSKEDETPKY